MAACAKNRSLCVKCANSFQKKKKKKKKNKKKKEKVTANCAKIRDIKNSAQRIAHPV